MQRTIKIYFSDFWKGFDMQDNFLTLRLKLHFNVIIDTNPDYLFYSLNGNNHLRYNDCVKIYFTGENDAPDFNLCDYAIGFPHITFEDRYLRLPLFVLYKCFENLRQDTTYKTVSKDLLNRKFCSFVVSNSKGADPMRELFFKQLSKYKKVDSGGRLYNNIGHPVSNKLDFIKDYKFNIAIENSSSSGYTTEKLIEPLVVNSIPIYWGSVNVQIDFNKKAFICINDFDTIEDAINEIIRLDNNDEAYLEMLAEPHFNLGQKNNQEWLNSFDFFICHIINQPIEKAKRSASYGYSKHYRNKRFILSKIESLPLLKYIIRKLSYAK